MKPTCVIRMGAAYNDLRVFSSSGTVPLPDKNTPEFTELVQGICLVLGIKEAKGKRKRRYSNRGTKQQ